MLETVALLTSVTVLGSQMLIKLNCKYSCAISLLKQRSFITFPKDYHMANSLYITSTKEFTGLYNIPYVYLRNQKL